MWDSINGTLIQPNSGASSPYIGLNAAPMYSGMSVVPPAMMGSQGMFGGMGLTGMPMCDTFCGAGVGSNLPFVPRQSAQTGSFGGFVSTALKVVGGVAVTLLALKFLKGKSGKLKAK